MKSAATFLILFAAMGAMALDIGSKAPPLDGVTWIKGAAPDFARQLTLVEFWATWCGPCRRSIPHLSELAKTYGDKLAIAGLSDEQEATVRPFVAKQGDDMAYNVGIVPKDLRGTYMAGVSGIPHAFLLDKGGTVVWAGHPMTVDDILAKALEGGVDITQLSRMAELEAALEKALRTRDLSGISASADALLAVDPLNRKARYFCMMVAKQHKDQAGFRKLFESVPMEGLSAEDAAHLANTLLSEPDLPYRNPDLAATFARHAVKESPEQTDALGTYARCLYVLGRIDEAITWQQKAVAAAEPDAPEPKMVLEYYRTIKRLQTETE